MLYPSIDKLLNVVDSKYKLVHIVSRRSRQILDNGYLQMKEYDSEREIGKALEEISEGLINVV